MTVILHIDTSVRSFEQSKTSRNSISKTLANQFSEQWKTKDSSTKFIYRDLGRNPPEFISEAWVAAVFTKEPQRTTQQNALIALSNELIKEVVEADLILLSTPMYNYGMPAVLKAWFDQVIRINETFTFDLDRGDFPLQPTLSGKTMALITSSGEFGFQKGGIREKMNHLGPHIKVASQYLGIEHFYEIRSEYQEFKDQRHADSLKAAQTEVTNLVERLIRKKLPQKELA